MRSSAPKTTRKTPTHGNPGRRSSSGPQRHAHARTPGSLGTFRSFIGPSVGRALGSSRSPAGRVYDPAGAAAESGLLRAIRIARLDGLPPSRRPMPPVHASISPAPSAASAASAPVGRVQTVLGPIAPEDLGWVLPHEHTAIALWHVPNRWDYWELRRDEPVIVHELEAFRAAGGRTLVDLTLDGVGRDPSWLAGLARTTGLHIVMGAGWY